MTILIKTLTVSIYRKITENQLNDQLYQNIKNLNLNSQPHVS